MPFTIPNDTSVGVNAASFEAQAQADKVDVDILVQALSGVGVVSGCAVTAHGGATMAVDVASGSIIAAAGGSMVTVAAQANLAVSAADATNPRIDLVTLNSSGTATMVNGTAAAVPCMPNTSNVVLAAVYVPAAVTSITSGMLTDKRCVIPAPSGSSALTLISSTTLGADAASVTFSSIPQTYKHLRLLVAARSDRASTADTVGLQFNGDVSGDYNYQQFCNNGGSALAANGGAQSAARIGQIAGNTAEAGMSGVTDCCIQDYTSSWLKSTTSVFSMNDPAGTQQSGMFGNMWSLTSAITSIKLLPVFGANFKAGSMFSLYGVS